MSSKCKCHNCRHREDSSNVTDATNCKTDENPEPDRKKIKIVMNLFSKNGKRSTCETERQSSPMFVSLKTARGSTKLVKRTNSSSMRNYRNVPKHTSTESIPKIKDHQKAVTSLKHVKKEENGRLFESNCEMKLIMKKTECTIESESRKKRQFRCREIVCHRRNNVKTVYMTLQRQKTNKHCQEIQIPGSKHDVLKVKVLESTKLDEQENNNRNVHESSIDGREQDCCIESTERDSSVQWKNEQVDVQKAREDDTSNLEEEDSLACSEQNNISNTIPPEHNAESNRQGLCLQSSIQQCHILNVQVGIMRQKSCKNKKFNKAKQGHPCFTLCNNTKQERITQVNDGAHVQEDDKQHHTCLSKDTRVRIAHIDYSSNDVVIVECDKDGTSYFCNDDIITSENIDSSLSKATRVRTEDIDYSSNNVFIVECDENGALIFCNDNIVETESSDNAEVDGNGGLCGPCLTHCKHGRDIRRSSGSEEHIVTKYTKEGINTSIKNDGTIRSQFTVCIKDSKAQVLIVDCMEDGTVIQHETEQSKANFNTLENCGTESGEDIAVSNSDTQEDCGTQSGMDMLSSDPVSYEIVPIVATINKMSDTFVTHINAACLPDSDSYINGACLQGKVSDVNAVCLQDTESYAAGTCLRDTESYIDGACLQVKVTDENAVCLQDTESYADGTCLQVKVTDENAVCLQDTESYADGTCLQVKVTDENAVCLQDTESYADGTCLQGKVTDVNAVCLQDTESYADGTCLQGKVTDVNAVCLQDTESYGDGTSLHDTESYIDGACLQGINQRSADVQANEVHGPLVNFGADCSVLNENIIVGTDSSDDRNPDSLIEGSVEGYEKVETNNNTVHDIAGRREANVDETEYVVATLGTCLNETGIDMCKPSLDAEEYISDINASNLSESEVLNNSMEMCIPVKENVLDEYNCRSTVYNSYMDILQINTNECASYMKRIQEHTSEIETSLGFNICLNEHNATLNVYDTGMETKYIRTDFHGCDVVDTAAADYTLQHISDAICQPCSQPYVAGNMDNITEDFGNFEELINWTGEKILFHDDIADDVSLISKTQQQPYEADIEELNKCDTYDENNNCLIEIYVIDSNETDAANSMDKIYVVDSNKTETNKAGDELFNVDNNSVNRQKHSNYLIDGINKELVNCDATCSMSVCGQEQYRDTVIETIEASDEQCRQEDEDLCGMDETTCAGNDEKLQLVSSIHGKHFATCRLAILPVPDMSGSCKCSWQTGIIDELETQEQGNSHINRQTRGKGRVKMKNEMKVSRTKLPESYNFNAIKPVSSDIQDPVYRAIEPELFKEQHGIQTISYSGINSELNTEHDNIKMVTDSTIEADLFNGHGNLQVIGGCSANKPELCLESSRMSKRHYKTTRHNNTDETKVQYSNSNLNSNDKNVKKKFKHTLSGSEKEHYKVGKGKRRKRKTDVCTQIVEDPRLRAKLMRGMKNSKYGDRPRVIRVTEDGTILDVTYEYRQCLPYQCYC